MRKACAIIFFMWLCTCISNAQDIDSISKASPFSMNGFVDIYYSYDFNEPKDHSRPEFLYSHNRHNEFALNNALISLKYNQGKVRGALGVHTGSYVKANYAAEPTIFQFIYEANVGVEIVPKVWIDAGIFSSHIGAESALSIDNLTLTRSLMAENSPYYESGIKLSYQATDNLSITGLVLNGWQNIVENNDNKAIGSQIQLRPVTRLLLNSSTFFGKEKAAYDSIPSLRFFHDFYAQVDLTEKISILASFDIGFQEKRNSHGSDIWYSPNLIIRFAPIQQLSVAGRIEYYKDKKGVIINTLTANGFDLFGASINLDCKIGPNILWRLEARLFNSKDKVFEKGNEALHQNASVASSLAIKF